MGDNAGDKRPELTSLSPIVVNRPELTFTVIHGDYGDKQRAQAGLVHVAPCPHPGLPPQAGEGEISLPCAARGGRGGGNDWGRGEDFATRNPTVESHLARFYWPIG